MLMGAGKNSKRKKERMDRKWVTDRARATPLPLPQEGRETHVNPRAPRDPAMGQVACSQTTQNKYHMNN
jgi:hypothetical protein